MNLTALDIMNCCFGYREMSYICPTGFTYLGSSFLCLIECGAMTVARGNAPWLGETFVYYSPLMIFTGFHN
ncbi:hypothetical protein Syun_014201 [Stephania yunnanensis]|uniref:Uncharacterized protein n=1 Tax=Stephania yunnanensis TaxID=152371 RepID=A0AAP0JIV7_9MAGN